MGETEAARVDVGALRYVADRYDGVADIVDAVVATHLARLTFDGAVAGNDYAGRGDTLRQTIGDVVGQMHMWSRACREIASALRTSGDRYVDVDAHGAVRLG